MKIEIDSRLVTDPQNTLFFAFKGVHHNGHDHVPELYRKGVRDFVLSEKRKEFDELREARIIYTEDVLEYLQRYIAGKREEMKAEIIAITGSNGKTIVKEWLYQALADEYITYRSPRSYNSQIGVPLSLDGIDGKTEIAIIEAGISQPGEMERLEKMIQPDIALFTHFGDAHSENFLSGNDKLHEKAVLFKEARVIIGRDGEALQKIIRENHRQPEVILWGERVDAAIRISSLHSSVTGKKVGIHYAGHDFYLEMPFTDEASFENCMHVVSILLYKGFAPAKIQEKINKLQPIAMRLRIKEGINDNILIDDYYNSDITSFRLAMSVLAMQDKGRKRVVVLSDFVDISTDTEALYSEVAEIVRTTGTDQFIGVGENLYHYRYLFASHSRFYLTTQDFLEKEDKTAFTKTAILIKGARKYSFEYISGFFQAKVHNTVLEVDMDAMLSNLNYFRKLLPESTRIALMVKAFSYGSGVEEVAHFLQYQGVDYLMVAFADEGVALRAKGIRVPIAVMNPEPEVFDKMIEFSLEPEIYSPDLLYLFDQTLKKHGEEKYPVHIKLNTGMNRSGINETGIEDIIRFFKEKRRIEIRSVFTHLAAADEEIHDEFTRQQLEKFMQMADKLQQNIPVRFMRHALNSSGIERFPEYALDMVRLGIGLHGISAVGADLSPVSTFKSYIMAIREVTPGDTVGYGRKGVIHTTSRIAVIPVGYADVLNRKLSNGLGKVYINGKLAPIIGNICMDTCMVDITGIKAQVGDEVEIFGKHIPVTTIASQLETIPYEVLTAVSSRVKRVYLRG